jgi:hypothetical protein
MALPPLPPLPPLSPVPPPPAPQVEITLRRAPSGLGWQAEVVVEGRHLHFASLLTLIGWLSRLGACGSGIR